ncbi:hypothetical protein L204_102565 [Cryptococcus depauperatus]|nr:cytoplasmic protein [Cryptococcus depauperatus CBS 7855]
MTRPTKPTPVTCFTGFLGAVREEFGTGRCKGGKTTIILSLIQQLPKDYNIVLLKNEYGDVEVDSILAQQSNITGVSEILNGCLCCVSVGLISNALIEIRAKFNPDRIIVESSGSAFPATLALQIKELETEGFKLDGVVTVVDCVNFSGYEDSSPSARLQAKYTDLLLLNKHHLLNPHQYDILLDHLNDLNDETPKLRVGPAPESPPNPEVIFGLDTRLWEVTGDERKDWGLRSLEGQSHWEEIETRTVYRGPPLRRAHGHQYNKSCADCEDKEVIQTGNIEAIEREVLERELEKLSFEIYRVKGFVRLSSSTSLGYNTHILNYAFSRYTLTPAPSLDEDDHLRGVGMRLTVMGERGEIARRGKRFAEAIGAQIE